MRETGRIFFMQGEKVKEGNCREKRHAGEKNDVDLA